MQKSQHPQIPCSKDYLALMNDLHSSVVKEVDQDLFYQVSLVDSRFSIANLAFNKTPNKSNIALVNQIPTGVKFSLMKKSEIKKSSIPLSTRIELQIA